MGKINVNQLRYLTKEDMRVLTAVEMGMKNHEHVPAALCCPISGLPPSIVNRKLRELTQHRLLAYERGRRFDGYRLSSNGYDLLALRALSSRDAVTGVGCQIGVGKESDIYLAIDANEETIVLKMHHLGRTSFRKLREKRDYHKGRAKMNWLYLSRIAAVKEFAFMKALHERGFPVPKPIDFNRHILAMSLVEGTPMNHVSDVEDPALLYSAIMDLIVRLGEYGLIHGDLNEFNLMLTSEGKPILIDFPQMVSTDHLNAKMYFDRDVQCVKDFFRKRFAYESELEPAFDDVIRCIDLDVEVSASGFTKQMATDLLEAIHDDVDSEEEEEDDDKTIDEEQSDENESMVDVEPQFSEEIVTIDNENNKCEEECPQLVPLSVEDWVESKLADNLSEDESYARSTVTSMQSIAPSEVTKRLKTQQTKKANRMAKTKYKVKGEACAVGRGRKDQKIIIKEYAGWDDFD